MSYPNGPAPQPIGEPPKKSNTFKIVLIAVGAFVLLSIVGVVACTALVASSISEAPITYNSTGAPQGKPENAPVNGQDEVKITKCAEGDYSFDVSVQIKNNSKAVQDYLIEVTLYDTKDNAIGSGFGSVNKVKPGKTGTGNTLTTLDDENYSGKVKCEVEVNRV